ncbi:hypothetical protein GDO86_003553 [Hymenochirus boettgeri]|uniref:Uncharacterized protein n=1 Tax=Hymenochirus boettgeri TaxID=247094 RepID=A0A8T2K7P8_9PIPI|nr:hypothetical protein GDO86_003553 [Hymenochirus boettgeri]
MPCLVTGLTGIQMDSYSPLEGEGPLVIGDFFFNIFLLCTLCYALLQDLQASRWIVTVHWKGRGPLSWEIYFSTFFFCAHYAMPCYRTYKHPDG